MSLHQAVPRFHSALKKLTQHGVEALRPQRFMSHDDKPLYKAPAISKRVANVLRKQAIQEGTYGSFANMQGWDASWDLHLAQSATGGNGRYRLRASKKTSRVRTRERRAEAIEAKMDGMDDRMEDYLAKKQEQKPVKSFETTYKKLMLAKK